MSKFKNLRPLNGSAEQKALIAEQLTQLEDDLRRLKLEFDIFLNGGAKRPPYDLKNRVDTMLKRLADERAMPYAQRYLYNSLMGRYTAFQNLWRRALKNREEGNPLHLPRRRATTAAPSDATPPPAPPPTNNANSFRCTDASREDATVKAMYASFAAAKKQCGENPDEIPYDYFRQVVASKADSIRARYQCEQVRFAVQINDGKVTFIAQPD